MSTLAPLVSAIITPRGIRNFNPGNIRRDSTDWLGLAPEQTDPDFFQFVSAVYGIRAISRILKTYQREGISTLSGAIQRWAPSVENDTDAYVKAVCDACQVQPEQVVDITAIMPQVVKAIITHENGQQPYSSDDINYAIALS